MSIFSTEVGRTYEQVAHLSECTIDPRHALDIAEWVVEGRHPVRSRLERIFRGHTNAWWQAQAIREHLAREMRCDA